MMNETTLTTTTDCTNKKSEKDEEEWKRRQTAGIILTNGEGFSAANNNLIMSNHHHHHHHIPRTLPADSNGNNEKTPAAVTSCSSISGSVVGPGIINGEKTAGSNNNKNIRLPTAALSAAKKANRNGKEAGAIPVGIAVAWQRLGTTATSTPVNDTICTTMSSSTLSKDVKKSAAACSSPPLVKPTPTKIKTPSQSPVPKRPSSTSSTSGGGGKEKGNKSSNVGQSSVAMTDVKCRPAPAQSVPLTPHGVSSAAKLSEHHYPFGALKYTDWPHPAGLNVPQLPQNYSAAAAAAYLNQQQQQQHRLQQLHMSHVSQFGSSATGVQNYFHHHFSPDALNKYEQYLLQHHQAVELARQQELQYQHQLHQLHHLNLLHPEYDLHHHHHHRATPIPTTRISIPSPSPTLHPTVLQPSAAASATTSPWPPEILHQTSAILSPKSLASTPSPSPVSIHDSLLCNTNAVGTKAIKTVPLGASSTSPPTTRAVDPPLWKQVKKINAVPKKVSPVTPPPTVKKCEKPDSPPEMEGDVFEREKSINNKKKHDFTRLESLIEKRDEISLPILFPPPPQFYTNEGSTVDSSDHLNPVGRMPTNLSLPNGAPEELGNYLKDSTAADAASSTLKPFATHGPEKGDATSTMKREIMKREVMEEENNCCDVPCQQQVDGVRKLVPEMKINPLFPVIKTESAVNSVGANLSGGGNKLSAQVLPTSAAAAASAAITSKEPASTNKQSKLKSHEPDYFNGVDSIAIRSKNEDSSAKPVKREEPIILAKSVVKVEHIAMSNKPTAKSMTVLDDSQTMTKKKNNNQCNSDSSLPVMKTSNKSATCNGVGTPAFMISNNKNSNRDNDNNNIKFRQSEQSKAATDSPATKCDTDIITRLNKAPYYCYSLHSSSANNNKLDSDTISDPPAPLVGESRRASEEYHVNVKGNKITGNSSHYQNLIVPLKQSSHQSSPPGPTTATTPPNTKIKSENVGDIIKQERREDDGEETVSSTRFQPENYRPIEPPNNHLDLLATVAQQFGNEIGLRKNPLASATTTTTTATKTVNTVFAAKPPASTTLAFDAYEFKDEDRSVPESNNNNNEIEPCCESQLSTISEESLPSLPQSRSSSPFTFPSFINKLPKSSGSATVTRPTVAPLVLRIPQVKSDPSSSTLSPKKTKKPKASHKRKDSENSVEESVKRKKKKRPFKDDDGNEGSKSPKKSKTFPIMNENAMGNTTTTIGGGGSLADRVEKAMKKSKKENVRDFWEPGELKVAPLKLTKRRSTTDAIVMKKGTATSSNSSSGKSCSLLGRDKVKKQRYSIESSSAPYIWSSSQSSSAQEKSEQEKHQQQLHYPYQHLDTFALSSSNKNKSSYAESDYSSDGLALGQSAATIKIKKKKKKKQQEAEGKPSSQDKSNALSQDLNKQMKKMKKSKKLSQDISSSISFLSSYNNPGVSNITGTEAAATVSCDSQVFSPASSSVENDWAANPAYAVTAIQASPTSTSTTSMVLAPCNGEEKMSSSKNKSKKFKPSKLALANLNKSSSRSEPERRKSKSHSSKSSSFSLPNSPSKKVKHNSHHYHIKPCLKAEPVRRSTSSPENDFLSDEEDKEVEVDISTKYSKKTEGEEPVATEENVKEVKQEKVKIESVEEMINDMRVLTEIQGLFYTGKLNALQPPDVYGVTLDNERGAPPHIIFSAEEVLEKCIRELKPEPKALVHGLRICAYWSPQYSGLYPGKISPDYVPTGDPYNELIPIEFDDGDTGVIKLNEIRLLSPDHPKGEYDPNPLLTLEKKHRKRRHSSAAGSQMSGCTGDHEEADCGESYCAKMGKFEDEGGKGKHSSKMLYWTWKGLGFKKPRSKKDRNKEFFEGIQRGDEVINVGDSALFTSSGSERPFIGRVEKFWEKKGHKIVKVRWYYHPDEVKTNKSLKGLYAGALFESPHLDENDVQTIAKKCDVLPFEEFKERVGSLSKWSRSTSQRGIYFVSGFYDPYTYNLKLKDLK